MTLQLQYISSYWWTPSPKSISAGPTSNRCPHRTHTSITWAELNWMAPVLAQAVEATLTESKKCPVKIKRLNFTEQSCKSLLRVILCVQGSKVATAPAQCATKPCHCPLRKKYCPYCSKIRGTVLFRICSHLDISMTTWKSSDPNVISMQY